MSDVKWIDLQNPNPQSFTVKGVKLTFTVGATPPATGAARYAAGKAAAAKSADGPYLLVELWESRDGRGWESLSREERENTLGQIGTGVKALMDQGLEQLGFFRNIGVEGRHRAHWQFVAVWRLPSRALLEKMLPQVDTLKGWFKVMNEERVWGRVLDPLTEGTTALLEWPHVPEPDAGPERTTPATGDTRRRRTSATSEGGDAADTSSDRD